MPRLLGHVAFVATRIPTSQYLATPTATPAFRDSETRNPTLTTTPIQNG